MPHKVTINLMQKAVYPNLKRQSLEVGNSLGHDLSVRHGATVVKKMPKFVKGLGPCVGITIFGLNKKFIAHSAPELDPTSNVKKFLSKKIAEMRMNDKCKEKDMSAVIYGGIAFDESNPLSEDSCRLVDAMEEACELEGIEPTIITGQFNDGLNTRLDSYVGQNQVTIWGKLIDQIKSHQNATQAEIQNILEQIFEYVKIPQNTEVKIFEGLSDKVQCLFK